jgi:hypothetical protein
VDAIGFAIAWLPFRSPVRLVILVIAGLFVRSLSAMQTMDFGFKPDHVMNFAVDASEIGMTDAQTQRPGPKHPRSYPSARGRELRESRNRVPMGYFNNGGDRMIVDGAPVPDQSLRIEAQATTSFRPSISA